MEENNLPKVELKADLTKSIENAYNDTLKEPCKSSSGIVSTVLDFFHNTVLYPMQKYNLYAENKLQNYALELQNKAQSIPEENLISPRVNILGPTIEGLKYNLDEEHIKEMFTNILVSDMDNRKQNKVLPSYIEIVKQLSKEDAKTLKFLKEKVIKESPIIKIKYVFNNDGFTFVSDNIGLLHDGKDTILDDIVLDNLCRLKLIELNFDMYMKNETVYKEAFEKIKLRDEFKTLPNDVKELGYSQGLLKITQFGKNFIDICLS